MEVKYRISKNDKKIFQGANIIENGEGKKRE